MPTARLMLGSSSCHLRGRSLSVVEQIVRIGHDVLMAVVCCTSCCFHTAQAAQETQRDTGDLSRILVRTPNGQIDTRVLVEALVNRNTPPTFVGGRAIFDAKYDWSEYRRVWTAIRVATDYAEEAWPELLKHLDDKRYCITAKPYARNAVTWTVGEMCRTIMGRWLAEGYYSNLRPPLVTVLARLRTPEVCRDKEQFRKWCEARVGKKLYELQIEMCEWAIPEVAGLEGISHLRRRAWVAGIQAEVESLGETRTPEAYRGFGPEELIMFTQEEADRIRKDVERRQSEVKQ